MNTYDIDWIIFEFFIGDTDYPYGPGGIWINLKEIVITPGRNLISINNIHMDDLICQLKIMAPERSGNQIDLNFVKIKFSFCEI